MVRCTVNAQPPAPNQQASSSGSHASHIHTWFTWSAMALPGSTLVNNHQLRGFANMRSRRGAQQCRGLSATQRKPRRAVLSLLCPYKDRIHRGRHAHRCGVSPVHCKQSPDPAPAACAARSVRPRHARCVHPQPHNCQLQPAPPPPTRLLGTVSNEQQQSYLIRRTQSIPLARTLLAVDRTL